VICWRNIPITLIEQVVPGPAGQWYMHGNRVKRALVASPEQWRWSSYRFYLFDEAGPVTINVGWTEISFSRSRSLSRPKPTFCVRNTRPCTNAKTGHPQSPRKEKRDGKGWRRPPTGLQRDGKAGRKRTGHPRRGGHGEKFFLDPVFGPARLDGTRLIRFGRS
jgi:hypothetical protein